MSLVQYKNTGISQKVVDEIRLLAQKYNVNGVILFGSRACGDYRMRSDIDLAFWGGNSASFIYDVDEETSTLLSFDIVDLEKPVQSEMLASIKSEGIMIYEKV